MAVVFTSIDDILAIMDIYNFVMKNEGVINLGHFQPIAKDRWSWLVENWIQYRDRFIALANGDENLTQSIKDLELEVDSYNLGNKNNPFANKDKFDNYRTLLEFIPINEINPTPQESKYMSEFVSEVARMSEFDFRRIIDYIEQQIVVFAQTIGLDDPDAAEYYGIKRSSAKERSATVQDLGYMSSLRELTDLILGYIINLKQNSDRPPNLLTKANDNIDITSEVRIEDNYISYIAVPFEFSLEHMAKKYLNTNNWYELVTVNNLQPPFVDKSGQKFNLLSPASVNSLIISSDLKDSVAPGVKIGIGSYRYPEETRRVERVIVNPNETMVLYLSGKPDLNRFRPSDKAFVKIYKPHTVREGSFVNIPSASGSVLSSSKPTPTKDELRRLESAFIEFGIDVYRDENSGDWIVGSNGNFKYAYGGQAVRQASMNAIRTEKGELPFHPNYGVDINIGDRFLGTVDEAVLFGESIIEAILSDYGFEDAKIAKISATETGVSVQVLVKIVGYGQPMLLSFVN